MNISVVIPVYKKSEMLMRHLRHNMPYMSEYEIIIVDDASDEKIKEQVKKEFPQIIVLENEKNMGFAPTVNKGIYHAHGDFVLLLNSDVKLIHPFHDSYFKRFKDDKDIFAISFMQKERDGSYVGKNRIYFEDGFPKHCKSSDHKSGLNGWAEGGSCIIRMDYLKKLGGFSAIYAPFYWEDIDLSYRAYSKGWYVMFDPKIVVEHHHESTVGSFFSKKHVKAIAYRNQFLFTWINMTDAIYSNQHLSSLPKHILKALLRGDMEFLSGMIKALSVFTQVISLRERKKKLQAVSDKEIFQKFAA